VCFNIIRSCAYYMVRLTKAPLVAGNLTDEVDIFDCMKHAIQEQFRATSLGKQATL
jgi:hypothetical protein